MGERVKTYWDLAVSEGEHEASLYLYNVIDSYAYEGYSDSAQSILKDLQGLGDDISKLNVYINSPGGSVFEGMAIYNILDRKKRCGMNINVVIDGMAASIASVIAMAGTTITMSENSFFMIHPASSMCWGNAKDMEEEAAVLRKIDTQIKTAYLNRCKKKGLAMEDFDNYFENGDNWFTSYEAYDLGLCDEVTQPVEIAAQYNKEALNMYSNVPDNVFRNMFKNQSDGQPESGAPTNGITAEEISKAVSSAISESMKEFNDSLATLIDLLKPQANADGDPADNGEAGDEGNEPTDGDEGEPTDGNEPENNGEGTEPDDSAEPVDGVPEMSDEVRAMLDRINNKYSK